MTEAKRMVSVPADVLERMVDLTNPMRGYLDTPGRVKLILRDEEYAAMSEVRTQVGHYLRHERADGGLDLDRATAFLLAVNDLCEEHGYFIQHDLAVGKAAGDVPTVIVSFAQSEQPYRLRTRRKIGEEMRAALEGA